MQKLILILLISGAFGVYMSWQEWRMMQHTKGGVAQHVKLVDLAKRGMDGDWFCSVTDFELTNTVTMRSSNNPDHFWAAGVPTGTTAAQLTSPPMVIVDSLNFHSTDDVQNLARHGEMRGLVVSSFRTPPADVIQALHRAYPGTDPGKCILFQVGREPASTAYMWCIISASIAMLGLGGLLAPKYLLGR